MPDETAARWKDRVTDDVDDLQQAADKAKGGSELEQAAANEALAIGKRNTTATWNADNNA